MRVIKNDNQTVFCTSSEDMKELVDGSIDVVLTSPPYNVGKVYSAKGRKYDDRKDHSDYLSFLTKVFKECYRVSSSKCIFFLNIGDSAASQGKSEEVVRCAVAAGFKRLQTVIWIKSIFGKGHYTPSGGTRRLNNLWEYVFILIKSKDYQMDPKSIGIPYSDKSNIGRYSDVDLRDAGDLWFIPYRKTTGATIKKGHDAPFPVELPLRCLKLVPSAKTVLDPFVGTGSTLRAAEELGLTGYGYEILPREEVIVNRLKEPFFRDETPLLPQLEFYADSCAKLLDKSLLFLTEKQVKELTGSMKGRARKQFRWSCQDLGMKPEILDLFDADSKEGKKGKEEKEENLLDYLK